MPAECSPTFDLPCVVFMSAAHVIATIPLEPPSWVVLVYPPFLFPYREWLGRIYTEEIDLGVMHVTPLLLKLRFSEPIFRKLLSAVAHVDPTKDAEREHLLGRELWLKIIIEPIFPLARRKLVAISALHLVVYNNLFISHIL